MPRSIKKKVGYTTYNFNQFPSLENSTETLVDNEDSDFDPEISASGAKTNHLDFFPGCPVLNRETSFKTGYAGCGNSVTF